MLALYYIIYIIYIIYVKQGSIPELSYGCCSQYLQ